MDNFWVFGTKAFLASLLLGLPTMLAARLPYGGIIAPVIGCIISFGLLMFYAYLAELPTFFRYFYKSIIGAWLICYAAGTAIVYFAYYFFFP